MRSITKELEALKKQPVKKTIDKRLKEFRALGRKGNKEWFSELCFCLLTANTSAELGIKVQGNLGYEGFTCHLSEKALAKRLKHAKYRFYNRRAHFIFLACQHKENIKNIMNSLDHDTRREWLVKNIKGLGWKESSHFLRNTGYEDYAILDKHVLRVMQENSMIKDLPKSLNEKKYLNIEKKLQRLCDRMGMSHGELDLYLWYMKTGKVLK